MNTTPRLAREPLRWWKLAMLVGGIAAAGRIFTLYVADCLAAWLGR